MRSLVLAAARELAIPCEVTDFTASRLAEAEEMFLTNAITGVRAVGEVIGLRRFEAPGAVTSALIGWTSRSGE
jgi:branched-subunit amino acid aminotransferase/4-amino-4-deoxychorismate lyase